MTLSNYEAARLRSMSARATGTMPKDGRLADPMTRTWHRDLKGPGVSPHKIREKLKKSIIYFFSFRGGFFIVLF